MNFSVVFFLTIFIGLFISPHLGEIQFVYPQQMNEDNPEDSFARPVSVKITSHSDGEKVPVGKLTISGISSDDSDRNCLVYVDWNNKKPFQQVRASGPGGVDDFSEWFFTYDSNYHQIMEGNNDLTSKIMCVDENAQSGTKWYSINLIGISNPSVVESIQRNNTVKMPDQPIQNIIPGFNSNPENIIGQNNLPNSNLPSVKAGLKPFPNSDGNDAIYEENREIESISQTNTSILETNMTNFQNIQNNFTNVNNDSGIDMIDATNDQITVEENSNNSSINTNNLNIPIFDENTMRDNNLNLTSEKRTNEVLSDKFNVILSLPDNIALGNTYTLEISVINNGSLPIHDAIISGEIYNSDSLTYDKIKFFGKTDIDGSYKFPLEINKIFPTGEYSIKVLATKLGSPDSVVSKSFMVSNNIKSSNSQDIPLGGNVTNEVKNN
ncbi:MAG TPA: hypothetical protein VFP25_02755 [Nitrososphaeraceae archaeon]|nr:hypothetical protein [Nitrososphaeraceae archaeon]